MDTLIKHLAQNSAEFITELLADALRESSAAEPAEFLRLPPPGQQCPVTGLKRSAINMLVLPCKENDFKPPVIPFPTDIR